MKLTRASRYALTLALLAAPSIVEAAPISFSTNGGTYGQDFDSLPSTGTNLTWTDGTTLTGWHVRTESASPTRLDTATGAGAIQNEFVYSLGIAGTNAVTDRALGGQNVNSTGSTVTRRYGAQISNDTVGALTQFSLSYAGEQYRHVANEPADSLTFDYQVFPAGTGSLTAATGWTSVPLLTFIAPFSGSAASSGHDGNASNRRAVLSETVAGLNWQPGQELWLRWTDPNTGTTTATSTRAVLAVDDVSFTAVPEPTSLATLLAGGLLFRRARRRGN